MYNRYLSVTEVCTYLGIKRDTIYKWISQKKFPAYRIGKLWKFKADEIDKWVKKTSNN